MAGFKVWGSNPGRGEIFRTRPDLPLDPPSQIYNGYQAPLPDVKRRAMALTTRPHLEPRLKKE